MHKDLEAQVKEMKDQLQESEAKLIVKTHEFEEKLKEKDNEFQQKWESERQEQEKLKDTVENLESGTFNLQVLILIFLFKRISRRNI